MCLNLLFTQTSFAAIEGYSFKFQYKGEQLKVTQQASDEFQALTLAAKTCFKHFKNNKKLSETEGLDLIDICANPKNI